MVKKIIHCADIHIRTYRMHDEYEEVFSEFVNQIKELIKDYDSNEVRIVIVGDLVHQKITISNEQLILACNFLRNLADIAPLIVVAGNHDLLENNKDRMDSISPMISLLNHPNISYFRESLCYEDDNIVWANYSIFDENKPPEIAEYRKTNSGEYSIIGLYHAPLVGARTDIGYEFEHGTALEHFEGCDIVMLGDIHKRQSFTFKGTPIAYPSSLIQQNFGETVGKHGFLFWDVESRTYTEHDIETNFGFYQFKIKSLDDLDEGKEKLTNR